MKPTVQFFDESLTEKGRVRGWVNFKNYSSLSIAKQAAQKVYDLPGPQARIRVIVDGSVKLELGACSKENA